MYNVRQFKPALYVLLFVGISGFALAAQSPAIWVLGCGAVLLNGWLVKTDRFVPMPRLLANLVTIVAVLYITRELLAGGTRILIIGQFLVLLQIIKLWEQRANRDYAQLLVLSLLLMVAAAISTASLTFGLLLMIYLFLSLYCCLLFHLKVESDAARAAFAIPEERINPLTLRQDQRHLFRSMQKLTALVSLFAVGMGIIVFLLFPRGTGAGTFDPFQYRRLQAMTGFSEHVSLDQVARIQQNEEVVAHVRVWRDGVPVNGTMTLLLRGLALDVYSGDKAQGSGRAGAFSWMRSDPPAPPGRGFFGNRSNLLFDADLWSERNRTRELQRGSEVSGTKWRQVITLQPTGTTALFAMPGPISINPRSDVRGYFSLRDRVLRTFEAPTRPLEYEVVSIGSLEPPGLADAARNAWIKRSALTGPNPPTTNINPRIRDYALRPDVSGSNSAGPLAAQRGPTPADPLDERIAANIEHHLRSHFRYTLDLTDTKRVRGQDPIVAFLYDIKRGHCEYFAGAMTLMCQSLGLKARMVVGFKCDEFSTMGDYYIVRQSHAHTWVEVLTADGWKTFDPTSGQDADLAQRKVSTWQRMKHIVDYLEYTYASNVIAYDNENRENLIQNVENRMTNAAISGTSSMSDAKKWFDSRQFYTIFSNALTGFVLLMVLAVVWFVGQFLWERWKLRRRALRIGLESLPVFDQLRLVRQLEFYDNLMLLLGRHHLTRPRHLTPKEFTNSLMFLPSDIYETVRRLTDVFYRVRYGRSQLTPALQRRLATTISRLDTELQNASPAS